VESGGDFVVFALVPLGVRNLENAHEILILLNFRDVLKKLKVNIVRALGAPWELLTSNQHHLVAEPEWGRVKARALHPGFLIRLLYAPI
jgi:hypothetical protein